MSLLSLRAPGRGRRQAQPNARLAAENQRLRHELALARHELKGAGYLIAGLRVQRDDADEARRIEVRRVAAVLGEQAHALLIERAAHAATRQALDRAVRANEANANAETVQTDVSAFRAATADIVPGDTRPAPQYAPYTRHYPASNPIEVTPLWASPQAAHPAHIPAMTR